MKCKQAALDTNVLIDYFNDIWIAACCLARNVTLVTQDSDFQRVPDLSLETLRFS